MKKSIFIIIISCIGYTAAAQTDDGMVTEEKSSAWVKVATTATVTAPTRSTSTNTSSTTTASRPAPRNTPSKPAATQTKPSPPKQDESFKKTNQKVKRFKRSD